MIIGLCGKAGSGKDTVGDFLVRNHHFAKIALADPLKKICKEVFDFSDAQLWGPSEKRNEPDPRYLRQAKGSKGFWGVHLTAEDLERHEHLRPFKEEFEKEGCLPSPTEDVYLTPRYALQRLGTEWGRDCYPKIWIDLAVRTAKELLREPFHNLYYTPQCGVYEGVNVREVKGVVITDVRFKNEIDGLRERGAFLVRVTRPSAGLSGEASQHASEKEMDDIEDSLFDAIIRNDGTLNQLEMMVSMLPAALKSRQELQSLLRARQKDVEAGKIREISPSDIGNETPPFKR